MHIAALADAGRDITDPPAAPAARWFVRGSAVVAAMVMLLGPAAIAGWALDITVLKTVLPGLAAMNPTTAIGFMLSGLSLWLWRSRDPRLPLPRLLGVTCACIGALKMIALLHGPDVGIDRLLFLSSNVAANPMAPNTALCFLLAGAALALIDTPLRANFNFAQVLALLSGALAMFAVVGYVYSASSLYLVKTFFPMALHTAIGFLLVSAGILWVRPSVGIMAVLSSGGPAGKLARRLLPAALLIPSVLGWLRLVGERQGLFTRDLGFPLIVLANTIIFVALVWYELEILREADAERESADRALRASEARTRLIIDAARDAFIAMDADGRIIDWNPQAQSTFGWTRPEAIGRPVAETIIPERYRVAHRAGLARFFQSGDGPVLGRRIELSATDKEGREFPVELAISPVRVEDTWIFFSLIHDITERKRAEEERDRIFTLSLDMVGVAGFDGYFKRVNGAFETTLGYTCQEFLTQPFIDFVHPDDRAATEAESRKLAAGAVTLYFENRYRCKSGEYKWLSWSVVPVVKENLLYAVARDMTERKRVEAELREKNRLLEQSITSERAAHQALRAAQGQLVQSEKLAGLGQMVAGVAHEINNPLSFVHNNVAVLERDITSLVNLLALYGRYASASEAEQKQLLGEIHEWAERIDLEYTTSNMADLLSRSREGLKRIQQIVKDLRDFARLDQSELQEADLNAGIESTVNIVRGYAKKRQVLIKTELASLPSLKCYPAKLNQVVMNLVVNAIDASRESGVVTVRSQPEAGGVMLQVIDEGEGIAPAIREKIFDPFFTTKPIGKGTGLGLSISYGIVRDHKGRIAVQSEVGKGSTFTVWLPSENGQKEPADGQ